MSTAFAGSLSHPRLPPELISLIFEFLAADRDWVSLGACSLLSNQCLRSARKLLFLSVTLRLRSDPNPILIHDISRRIQGLCDLLKRDPDTSRYIKVFEVLDSYPVYDSQWITQQTSLPRLINKLTNVQECTFGSEVGYLQWGLFSPELAASLQKLFSYPHLKILTLCNVGMIPTPVLKIPVRYLQLNNITTLPTLALLGEEPESLSMPDSRLCYLNVRTASLANTDSAWELMQVHSTNLKLIKWRCWEDARARDGVSFPGSVDLGKLPSLMKLSIRMSYGKVGRDLLGLCDLLESVSRSSQLKFLELSILFPLQSAPERMSEIYNHAFWTRLAVALLRVEYCALRQVTMELTVHEKVRMWNGRRENSVTEFRKKMKHSLRTLLNISSFHFKFKVHAFHLGAHE